MLPKDFPKFGKNENTIHVWAYPNDDKYWANYSWDSGSPSSHPVYDVTDEVEELVCQGIYEQFEYENRCPKTVNRNGIIRPCIRPFGHSTDNPHYTYDGHYFE